MALLLLALLGFSRTSEAAELSASIIGHTPAYPTYEVNYFTDNDLSTDYASNGAGVATHVVSNSLARSRLDTRFTLIARRRDSLMDQIGPVRTTTFTATN